MLAAQPTEDQSRYQCSTAGAQADWHSADVNGQCAEQSAYKDAEPYENHICLVGRTVYITQTSGGGFHFLSGSHYFYHVAGIYCGLCHDGDIDARTLDAADADAVHELLTADCRNGFSGKSLFGYHDGQSFGREVQ